MDALKYKIKLFFQKFNLIFWKGRYFTTDMALHRCKARGLKINTVIDVGASNRMWSKMCMVFYPDPKYFLIDAQEIHKKKLIEFTKEKANVQFNSSAAGNEKGSIYFNNDAELGGQASNSPYENGIEVQMNSIYNWVKEFNLQPPFLVKLDTHGFEVPILEGAKNTLSNTDLIIIEIYNFNLTDSSLTFWKICNYLKNYNFRIVEIVDLMARKFDNTLWQMDMFFIKSNDKVFEYNKFD